MHDHFEEGDGGDADMFEVMGVLFPGAGFSDSFLFGRLIGIESVALRVDELDGVFEF